MKMKNELIAPCGMNCGLCQLHLRSESKCPGCSSGREVNGRCVNCGRKQCKHRKGSYCYECDNFPCDSVRKLDERYRNRYGMSEIENLETIRDKGIDFFLKQEEKKWVNEDGVFCVHDKKRYK